MRVEFKISMMDSLHPTHSSLHTSISHVTCINYSLLSPTPSFNLYTNASALGPTCQARNYATDPNAQADKALCLPPCVDATELLDPRHDQPLGLEPAGQPQAWDSGRVTHTIPAPKDWKDWKPQTGRKAGQTSIHRGQRWLAGTNDET